MSGKSKCQKATAKTVFTAMLYLYLGLTICIRLPFNELDSELPMVRMSRMRPPGIDFMKNFQVDLRTLPFSVSYTDET